MRDSEQSANDSDRPIEAIHGAVQSGLPLAQGLRAYAEESPTRIAVSLRNVANSIERGIPVSLALEESDVKLPLYLTELIEGGIQSNTLGVMLETYLHHRRRQRRLGQRAVLDILYPLLVLLLTIVLTYAVMIWLIPMFKSVFLGFDLELPFLTRMLIDLSDLVILLMWPLAFGIAGLSGLLLLIATGGRATIMVLDRIPFLGATARYATMSEFCYLLAPLIESGVPIRQSLEAVGSAMNRSRVKSGTIKLARMYDGSEPLSDIASERGLLPHELVHLLSWESRGAAFAEILRSWGDMFNRMASSHSAKITAILSPLLMVGIGFLAGLLVLALFYPLVKLLNDLS